jgi:exopolyphosphatase/guanosine-5'-triphosphate,3'-diphosphate pyrophosphatase
LSLSLNTLPETHPTDRPHEGRIGIIDIGSNSIRLVIYSGIKRTPQPLYNEKVFCALGKGLEITGKLNPEGVKLAYASIARLLTIARLMDVVELKILATAAIRDAKDGRTFVETVADKYQVNITVISGKREARLAAAGVMSSFYEPDGLVGDMGGGSIELIRLKDHSTFDQDTLPIGPLRMIDATSGNKVKMQKLITKRLNEITWLAKTKASVFYAIGGSFRALAHIHMEQSSYPLHVLHHYSAKRSEILKLCKHIIPLSEAQISKLPGMAPRRVSSMAPAAMVMQQVLEQSGAGHVIFSTSGIREGYLYEKLSPYLRAEDPLTSSAMQLMQKPSHAHAYAKELFAWAAALFPKEPPALKRLRLAVSILSEIADLMHPEYRADWAFHHVLQSSLTGADHREKVMIALALYHRYKTKLKDEFSVLSLISPADRDWAKLVGTSAHLAYHLSGGMSGNLAFTKLSIKKSALHLYLSSDVEDLMSDAIRKRIDGLGEALKAFSSRAK